MPTEIERLYREHRAGLVRLVERELHDCHDAEDVVQTAFLDAQRAIERGTIPRNPRAWLATIALNAARRLRRRRLNAAPLEDYAVQEASGMTEIRAALTSLPREQRTAVLYRDLLGLSYGETADKMGRSVNAVTMLLHRGRRGLRQTLGVTTAGVGVWRWLKRAGMPQITAVKGAAAIVAAAGLATTGVVAARAVAPIGTDRTAALAMRLGSPAVGAKRTPEGAVAIHSARRRSKTPGGSKVSTTPTPTQGPGGGATPGSGSAGSSAADVVTQTLSHSRLPVPTVSLPTMPIPTVSIPTLPATVTVTTPVTTATVAIPTVTTVTVTTPITTVTLPVP